ncbi:MAG: hypothetical protein GY696_40625 [Gammaproteobacteria bacterium]|nr:hypothetical protein [Gammaproteobacteria bacterium]
MIVSVSACQFTSNIMFGAYMFGGILLTPSMDAAGERFVLASKLFTAVISAYEEELPRRMLACHGGSSTLAETAAEKSYLTCRDRQALAASTQRVKVHG